MIWIAPHLSIEEKDLQWDFVRATGPGGQNVNKVSTAVQLRLNVLHNERIPPEVKERLQPVSYTHLTLPTTERV